MHVHAYDFVMNISSWYQLTVRIRAQAIPEFTTTSSLAQPEIIARDDTQGAVPARPEMFHGAQE
eukprot:351355-Pyramimonas_sp.AAC.1